MGKISLLLVNFKDDSFIVELQKLGYRIDYYNTRRNYDFRELSHKLLEYDVVYFAKFVPPTFDDLPILVKKLNIPIVYGWHYEYLPFIFNLNRPSNYVQAFIGVIKVLWLKIRKPVSLIHVLNYDQYKYFVKLALPTIYIPLGVDTKLFKSGKKFDEFTVTFVSPRYGKGVDFLMKIVPSVIRKRPDVKFILTGIGFLGPLYYRALKSSFPKNVIVCENLPREEFIKILSKSHVLLFPSRRETFGRVVLEALSCGTPVVAFDIPGAPRDIVKRYNCGIVVKPFNVKGIIAGLLYLYELFMRYPETFQSLSKHCRSIAEKFDWKNLVRQYDAMFRKILL